MAINREITLTNSNWTAVANNIEGQIIFQVNAAFTWAFGTPNTPPTITGFTGVSGTLYTFLNGSQTLWIKGANNNKVQVFGGSNP